MTCSSWLSLGVLTQLLPFFEFVAFVDQQRDVAAVVDDQLRAFAAGMVSGRERAIPVFLQGLAFPGEDRHAGLRDRGGGLVLGARKCCNWPSALTRPSSTSVSIRTAVSMVMCSEPVTRTPLSGLLRRVFLADRHQPGHFLLGDLDLFAAPFGQADVFDFVIGVGLPLRIAVGVQWQVMRRDFGCWHRHEHRQRGDDSSS